MRPHIIILYLLYAVSGHSHAKSEFEPADICRHDAFNNAGMTSNTFSSDEMLKLDFIIDVEAEDRDNVSVFYMVAKHQQQYYMRNTAGDWLPWDGLKESLVAIQQGQVHNSLPMQAFDHRFLPPGEFIIYTGYLTPRGTIKYSAYPAALFIIPSSQRNLQRFENQRTLTEFLQRSWWKLHVRTIGLFNNGSLPDFPAPQTDIQENGVDLAKRMQQHGNIIFTLERSEETQTACLSSYRMSALPAMTERLDRLDSGSDMVDALIYLHQTNNPAQQSLIWLGGKKADFVPLANQITGRIQVDMTEVRYVDASNPKSMQIKNILALDGKLLFSRLLGKTLYLVTQHDIGWLMPVFDGDNDPTSSTLTLSDEILIPKLYVGDAPGISLYQSHRCYVPPRDSESMVYHAALGIVAIPLDNPDMFTSECLLGSLEAIYATDETLYLASTRANYAFYDNKINYKGLDLETDIHKLHLNGQGVDYLGSGAVAGHLGWNAANKALRIGENAGIVKIATSQGSVWDLSEPTRVTLLQENVLTQAMETIGMMENIGNPNQEIQAVKFIGNQGYLFPYKVTDPITMLDFSNPQQPKIIGELDIASHPGLLLPLGENHLLSIGRELIPDDDEPLGGWHQGLKLSLFDVSDPLQVQTVNSLVFGQRGSHSPVLDNEQALAVAGESLTIPEIFAMPVAIHDANLDNDLEPWVDEEWSHTGLYTFRVNLTDNPGIHLIGNLTTESLTNGGLPSETLSNDRAVIQDNTVHYIHNNQIISSVLNGMQSSP